MKKREQAVRIDDRTVILIKAGKDPVKAKEKFLENKLKHDEYGAKVAKHASVVKNNSKTKKQSKPYKSKEQNSLMDFTDYGPN